MAVEEVRALATGLTFTGIDAVENGLADEVGTQQDAVAKAAELANMSAYTTVALEPAGSDLSTLLDLMSSSDVSVENLVAAMKEMENDGRLAH